MRGLSRLSIDAIVAVVALIEALQYNVASIPGILGKVKPGRATGIAGLVYRSISGAIGLVGQGLDQLLATLNPLLRSAMETEGARSRPGSRASARSAAPASPTSATATSWTRTG